METNEPQMNTRVLPSSPQDYPHGKKNRSEGGAGKMK